MGKNIKKQFSSCISLFSFSVSPSGRRSLKLIMFFLFLSLFPRLLV